MPPDSSTIKIDDPTKKTVNPAPTQNIATGETQRWKYRARFRKAGDLRLVSHHDLMHVVERMFRRADLRLCVTQGFNPRPKMVFALSLALGVAGLNEVLEFETAESIAAEEIERRLKRQCPPGLEILSVRAIDWRTSAQVRRAIYRLSFTLPEGPGLGASEIAGRITALLEQPACWIDRTRPHPRRINVRPFIHELTIKENNLVMALWITPNGAARPEEVIAALGLTALLDAGAVIERTDLELYDELPPEAEHAPVIQAAFTEITTNEPAPSESGRPSAIFDSPMSFET